MQGRTDSVAVAFFCIRCYFYTWCVFFFLFVCLCVCILLMCLKTTVFFSFSSFPFFFLVQKKEKADV